MRDIRRIDKILKKIRKYWKANPDLRLMQLLGNCWEGNEDRYYTEDDELGRVLDVTYKKGREVK